MSSYSLVKSGCSYGASFVERTLDILYSAAQKQQQQQQSTTPATVEHQPAAAVQSEMTTATMSPQQTSLHSFWKLPPTSSAPLHNAPPPPPPSSLYAPTSCEDCGQPLVGGSSSGEADDAMMDVDGGGGPEEPTSCGACGKSVCAHCSITHLGEQRRCLRCAAACPPPVGLRSSRPAWAAAAGMVFG